MGIVGFRTSTQPTEFNAKLSRLKPNINDCCFGNRFSRIGLCRWIGGKNQPAAERQL